MRPKDGGHLLLTTPNLASWVNKLLLVFGYQPYNCEVSTEVLAYKSLLHIAASRDEYVATEKDREG
jgi:hypothetical protein